jgi:hypothetical protein
MCKQEGWLEKLLELDIPGKDTIISGPKQAHWSN